MKTSVPNPSREIHEPRNTDSRKRPASLRDLQIYKDYEAAFVKACRLPLHLTEMKPAESGLPCVMGNDLCQDLKPHDGNPACSSCHELNRQLQNAALESPATMRCQAGFHMSAVPVKIGKTTVAFLKTGQVFLKKPTSVKFGRMADQLIEWGGEVDLKKTEDAWRANRVIDDDQYQALLRMLEIFAGHLASCAAELSPQVEELDSLAIRHARQFIADHSAAPLTLASVARTVNLSAKYFCRKFKESTGMKFTEFIARVRIEKAMRMLREPEKRINEIAYEVGFRSVSQFNRVFRDITGQSPTEYRRNGSNTNGIAAFPGIR